MKKLLIYLITYPLLLTPLCAQNIIDVAGNGNMGYSGDGFPANSGYCELYGPSGIYIDRFGNMYIDDCLNNVIRMVNTNGIISTFAGIKITGYGGYSGDGGQATNAELNLPEDVCGDSAGNIFIADYDNAVIRMVNTSGIISTVVGSGFLGYSGDGGPATNAELNLPVYVFVDNQENIYISDLGNNVVRKVNASGIITTIAGNGVGGNSGDGGPATAAELEDPSGIDMDFAGGLYISVGYEVIRKVNTSGIISTIAGNGYNPGGGGFSGDGGPATAAELSFPLGICFDASGNLLFCDAGNYRIREVDTSGIISTIAGNGSRGRSGDGGPATAAELTSPWGVAVNQYGNVCFSDALDNVLREIVYHPEAITDIENNMNMYIYPNPTAEKLFVIMNRSPPQKWAITISDITGREVYKSLSNISEEKSTIDVSSFSPGIYFISIRSNETITTEKFIKL